MKLLTVAIPAYNAERYLDDCLASVFDQGLSEQELEVIIINDASTDGTLAIAERWAAAHSSIRVHDQASRGISYNRNLALSLATGKYFVYLDADDIVSSGAYAKLVEGLEASGSDFVTSPVHRFADWQRQAWLFTRSADLFDSPAVGLRFSEHPEFVRDFMVWNKVFRKTFLDEAAVPFPEGMIYEDIAVMPRLFQKADRFDVVSFPVVFWRITEGSITQTLRPAKALDRLEVLQGLRDHFTGEDTPLELASEFDFAILDYNLRWVLQEYHRYDAATQREIIERSRELVAPMQDAVVLRVPEPLRSWVQLLRSGDVARLSETLLNKPTVANLRVDASEADIRLGMEDQSKAAAKRRRRERIHVWKRRTRNVAIYLVFRPLVQLLPVDKNRVFVANYWGKKFSLSDGPAAIAARLSAERPDMKITVLSSPSNKREIEQLARELLEPDARLTVVKNHSFRYFYHLWRAKYLFNDVNFSIGFNVDRFVQKRRGQIEVQTTHGTPLKKMGIDSSVAISEEEMPKFLAKVKRYDYLVAPSPLVGEIFAASHNVSPTILQTGLPQNDLLFESIDSAGVSEIKSKYGLDPNRKLLVYAPTYRYGGGAPFPYSLDFEKLYRELGDEYQIAVKIHPFSHTRLNGLYFRDLTDQAEHPQDSPFVKLFGRILEDKPRVPVYVGEEEPTSIREAQEIPADINELMQASDLLVTDYSSILFNYPHLKKPLITFVPDAELYETNRGMYFKLEDIVPGPYVRDTDSLVRAVRLAESEAEWDTAFGEQTELFRKRFHEWETGDASGRILQELRLTGPLRD